MKKKAKKKAELLEKQLQQLEELEENLQINGMEFRPSLCIKFHFLGILGKRLAFAKRNAVLVASPTLFDTFRLVIGKKMNFKGQMSQFAPNTAIARNTSISPRSFVLRLGSAFVRNADGVTL